MNSPLSLDIWAASIFHVPAHISSQFEKYYLLHWQGDYFQTLYHSTSGRFKHQDTTYQVVFHQGKQAEVFAAKIVAVSFRKLKFQATGIALVRSLRD